MALELAQRLIDSEAVPRRAVEAALLRHAKEQVSFVRALLDLYPQYAGELRRELAQAPTPLVADVAPDPHLMAKLPHGLCTRMLGFPIGITSSSAVVDILIADPWNAHAAAEFAYHLGTRVRLVPGHISHLRDQLAALEGLGPTTARQDQLHMNDAAPDGALSAPPIPLTRLAVDSAEHQPGTARGVAPPAAIAGLGAANPAVPAVRVSVEVQLHDDPAVLAEQPKGSRVSVLAPTSDDLQAALSELAVADHADAVVSAVMLGLRRTAQEVIVFTVRGGSFKSRARASKLGDSDAALEVEATAYTLAQALSFGQYLGPLPREGAEARFLGTHYDEACVTRVDVSARPALMIFVAGFRNAYDVSLRSDHLARAACDALARIVLAKKR